MQHKKGFTLVELLIVIAIIIILLVAVLVNMKRQIDRANDAKRKADVYSINNAVEEYFNDRSGIPPQGSIDTCGGSALSPYLKQIPCDPVTRKSYGYFPSTTISNAYRLCAVLQDASDPAIAAIGCNGQQSCGVGGGFNWCLASGTSPSAVGTSDQGGGGGGGGGGTSFPTPSPTAGPGSFACSPPDFQGVSYCNSYADPEGSGCPVTFADRSCSNSCGNSANWCRQ